MKKSLRFPIRSKQAAFFDFAAKVTRRHAAKLESYRLARIGLGAAVRKGV